MHRHTHHLRRWRQLTVSISQWWGNSEFICAPSVLASPWRQQWVVNHLLLSSQRAPEWHRSNRWEWKQTGSFQGNVWIIKYSTKYRISDCYTRAEKLTFSSSSRQKAAVKVVISQVTMAAPGMSSVRGRRGRAVEFEISPHSIDNGKWSVILLLPTMTHSSPSFSTCHSFIYFLSSCAPSLLSPSLLPVILPIMQRLDDNKFMQVGL
jgi:hypothetical protein